MFFVRDCSFMSELCLGFARIRSCGLLSKLWSLVDVGTCCLNCNQRHKRYSYYQLHVRYIAMKSSCLQIIYRFYFRVIFFCCCNFHTRAHNLIPGYNIDFLLIYCCKMGKAEAKDCRLGLKRHGPTQRAHIQSPPEPTPFLLAPRKNAE